MTDQASDTPPDRLSLDPRSPFFNEDLLSRGVGIKFNGQEKTNVIEYYAPSHTLQARAAESRTFSSSLIRRL